jgi:hypothetical protein
MQYAQSPLQLKYYLNNLTTLAVHNFTENCSLFWCGSITRMCLNTPIGHRHNTGELPALITLSLHITVQWISLIHYIQLIPTTKPQNRDMLLSKPLKNCSLCLVITMLLMEPFCNVNHSFSKEHMTCISKRSCLENIRKKKKKDESRQFRASQKLSLLQTMRLHAALQKGWFCVKFA